MPPRCTARATVRAAPESGPEPLRRRSTAAGRSIDGTVAGGAARRDGMESALPTVFLSGGDGHRSGIPSLAVAPWPHEPDLSA